MGPPQKKRKTNTSYNRRISMNTGLNQSKAGQVLGMFSVGLVSSPLLTAHTDDRAAQPHWDTVPISDATVTLVYAENEPGSSSSPPEAGQASLVDHSNPTLNSAPPIMGPQLVGVPIALRKSFSASRPQLTQPPRSTMPSAQRPSQRSINAKDKKGKGKASPHKSNASVPKTSRHLTHEEIWDDSALVNAWDAAMDQHRVRGIPPHHVSVVTLTVSQRMNGGKDWSAVPVKESPL